MVHDDSFAEFAPADAEFNLQGAIRVIYHAHTADNLMSVAEGASALRDVAARIAGFSGGSASVVEETVNPQDDGKYYMRLAVDFLSWSDFMATTLRLMGADPVRVFPPDQVLIVYPEPNVDYMLDLRLLMVAMLHARGEVGKMFVIHFRTPTSVMSLGLTYSGRPGPDGEPSLEVVNLDPGAGGEINGSEDESEEDGGGP